MSLPVMGHKVQGLLLWGIVAVPAPAAKPIKETDFYFKCKTD